MLPELSGIEIYQKARQNEECMDKKLILFTGDDQPESNNRRSVAGIDEVVLNTSAAFEVIQAAIKLV